MKVRVTVYIKTPCRNTIFPMDRLPDETDKQFSNRVHLRLAQLPSSPGKIRATVYIDSPRGTDIFPIDRCFNETEKPFAERVRLQLDRLQAKLGIV